MRRGRLDLAHHAHHFFQFAHQLGTILQAAGGIDQNDVGVFRLGCADGIEGKTRRVGTRRAGFDGGAGPLAPDLELIDGRGTECIARHQHDAFSLGAEFGGELADGGGLAGAVDAGHQNDERPCRHFQRLGDGDQHFLDLASEHGFDLVGRDRLVEAALAQRRRHAAREPGAKIGADQFVLKLLDRRGIELALRYQVGDGAAERRRRALEPAT